MTQIINFHHQALDVMYTLIYFLNYSKCKKGRHLHFVNARTSGYFVTNKTEGQINATSLEPPGDLVASLV